MRRLFFFLIFFNALIGTVSAQSNDSIIKDIRSKYKRIRENLNNYDTTFSELPRESTEGGQGTAFYDKDELKLIELVFLGETGKTQTEYYFDKGKLIFVLNQDFNYNRPIYWNEDRARENNDNEVYDPKKTKVTEDRYYFKKEILFLWLDNNKKEADLKLETNSSIGKNLKADAYKMKDKLKK